MKGWGRGILKTAAGRKMFPFSVCACLSNKSPSQATLHKGSCTFYPWLSRTLLQLLAFSRQLLDFIISSSLLQRLLLQKEMWEVISQLLFFEVQCRGQSWLGL